MSIGKVKRFAVLNRDSFTCRYCGRSAPDVVLEVDHVIPRSAGGKDDQRNLVTACWECNRGKRHYLLSRGAHMVLEDDYMDPDESYETWEAAYVLAEQAFSDAIADAYQRGARDQTLRESDRPESERLVVMRILGDLASKASRIQ